MRKSQMKKQNKIIIVCLLCLLLCLCVGYAAFSMNLSITAKGNVKEKPNCEFGGIKVNTVTEGDGLYEDSYEEGKCTYKGANPNNYITFNNETWRIISINSDGLIKIIRNESIGNMAVDTTGGTYGSNDWDRPADLNTYLNSTYLSTITINKNMIVPHTWSIGRASENNSNLEGQINDENAKQSQSSSIGMITASEYLRANSNVEQCGYFSINRINRTICLTTNWIYNIAPVNHYLWTITPQSDDAGLFGVSNASNDAGDLGYAHAYDTNNGVSPVVYLKSDITLSGSGTKDNPFIIE